MKCLKCNYEWTPRITNPKCCPECKTRKWNIAQPIISTSGEKVELVGKEENQNERT
jgi:Zn finger protein HypA/HybF involved in hydrogenase expression